MSTAVNDITTSNGAAPPDQASGPGATYSIAIYAHARANVPHECLCLTWNDFITTIAAGVSTLPSGIAAFGGTPEEQKRALPAWSPVRLSEARRRADCVLGISLIAIDVDVGPDPAGVSEAFGAAGYASLIYETSSSTPEAPRYRLVCPPSREIRPDECGRTRLALAELIGCTPGSGVEACLDVARLYFVGRLHGTPERRVWATDGEPIDPDRLPATALGWKDRTRRARSRPTAHAVSLTPIDRLPPPIIEIVNALGPWQSHVGRKFHVCAAIGGLMRKHGYDVAQCEATLRAWLPTGDASVNVDHGVQWAIDAWGLRPKDVSGFAMLSDLLVERHAIHVADVIESVSPATRAFDARCARAIEEIKGR